MKIRRNPISRAKRILGKGSSQEAKKLLGIIDLASDFPEIELFHHLGELGYKRMLGKDVLKQSDDQVFIQRFHEAEKMIVEALQLKK